MQIPLRANAINSRSTDIKNILKRRALAVFAGAAIIPAHAATLETKGSPKIKSEDGDFELGINGAHLDVHSFHRIVRARAIRPSAASYRAIRNTVGSTKAAIGNAGADIRIARTTHP